MFFVNDRTANNGIQLQCFRLGTEKNPTEILKTILTIGQNDLLVLGKTFALCF